jgi:NTP pyrophosphatase (non-canonical NTP hydrolase)
MFMNLQEEALKMILDFRESRDWKQFHDLKNLALALNLEASEVLELFQWTKDNNLQPGKEEQLKDELADVYHWLLLLAHDANIDLDKALIEKIKKNAEKYPIEKAKGNSMKYTDL